MTDEELIERIAVADEAAFQEFFVRHSSIVLGLLHRMLADPSDADDALQETFWQVWRTAPSFNSERASPRSWLFILARSRAQDLLRKRKESSPPESLQCICQQSDPARLLIHKEDAERVRHALLKLPAEQRLAVSLSYYSGMTHQEISDHHQIAVGTVKTRIRLGMHQLRDLLKRGGHEE